MKILEVDLGRYSDLEVHLFEIPDDWTQEKVDEFQCEFEQRIDGKHEEDLLEFLKSKGAVGYKPLLIYY